MPTHIGNVRRQTIRCLAALSLLLSVAACGSSDEGSRPETQEDEPSTSVEGFHYMPTFISDRGDERDKEITVDQNGDGYVLTARTPVRTYIFSVHPSERDEGAPLGPQFADSEVATPGQFEWADPVARVSVEAPGANSEELQRIVDGFTLVDDRTHAAFMSEPTRDFEPPTGLQRSVRVGDRTFAVDLGGSLAASGMSIQVESMGGAEWAAGFEASLGVGSSFPINVWEEGRRYWALVRVPDHVTVVDAVKGSFDVTFGSDPQLGKLALIRTADASPVRYRIAGDPFEQRIDPSLYE